MTYSQSFTHCSRYCNGLLLVLHFFKGQSNRFFAGVNIPLPDFDRAMTHDLLYRESIHFRLTRHRSERVTQ
jgi:hypothetical protein